MPVGYMSLYDSYGILLHIKQATIEALVSQSRTLNISKAKDICITKPRSLG